MNHREFIKFACRNERRSEENEKDIEDMKKGGEGTRLRKRM